MGPAPHPLEEGSRDPSRTQPLCSGLNLEELGETASDRLHFSIRFSDPIVHPGDTCRHTAGGLRSSKQGPLGNGMQGRALGTEGCAKSTDTRQQGLCCTVAIQSLSANFPNQFSFPPIPNKVLLLALPLVVTVTTHAYC